MYSSKYATVSSVVSRKQYGSGSSDTLILRPVRRSMSIRCATTRNKLVVNVLDVGGPLDVGLEGERSGLDGRLDAGSVMSTRMSATPIVYSVRVRVAQSGS